MSYLSGKYIQKIIARKDERNKLEKPAKSISGCYNEGSKCMASILQLQIDSRGQSKYLIENVPFIKKYQYKFY